MAGLVCTTDVGGRHNRREESPKQTYKDQDRQEARKPERTAAVQRIEPALSIRSRRSPFYDRLTGPRRSPVIRWRRDERRATKNAVIGVRASRGND